jgi:DNA-binding PadR family transcriptional regulator
MMANGNAIFRHFILGLLARQSMSGYDIRRFMRSLGLLLGSPSFGTIYPTLHALLEDDLVTVEVVPQPNRPARKVYTITTAGNQALHDWVARPASSKKGLKAFVMHLILAEDSARDGLIAHLDRRRSEVMDHHTTLAQAAEEWGEQASPGQRLAIEYGLAMASAELSWLEDKLAHLSAELEASPATERV